ncbi:hypothetical protein HF576_10700 [Microbacterium sp. CFH 90308]|uniref:Uncharacterized protein n=1 Tax=Microbacterium salsuginis TaxID=2722803 RepID=A0ABX1KG11_9MICO|nr:hypothetical protein [Microbacterium sp. CFH 90308]NLP84321.1 hypothetical protein [Microbacterium sp. CFH 90308]
MRSWGASRWIAVAAIAVLAVVVGALAFAAYQRANPEPTPAEPGPVPSFDLGVQTQTPTPTAPAAVPVALDAQRYLSVGGEQWWRATAGACNGPAPVVERSPDGGQTWVDVTPTYRGIAQVQSLDAFSAQDAEMVAALAGCETQALRTYTNGEFWESYPDVLAASRYVNPTDAATVVLPSGPVAAPCAQASGLRASGDTVAVLCDGRAWNRADTQWLQLAPENAIALTLDGSDVIVAHTAPDCAGVAVSRATPESSPPVACAEGVDAAVPTAIDLAGSDLYLWSADSLVTVPIP